MCLKRVKSYGLLKFWTVMPGGTTLDELLLRILFKHTSCPWKASDILLQEETDVYIWIAIFNTPATEQRLHETRSHQENGEACKPKLVSIHISEKKDRYPKHCKRVLVANELTVQDGFWMRGSYQVHRGRRY